MVQEWVHGICGCTENVPWCLITCFFPCVTSYKVGVRLGMKIAAIVSVIVCGLWAVSDSVASYAIMNTQAYHTSQQTGVIVEPEEDKMYSLIQQVMAGVALISTIVFVLVVFKFRMALRAKQDIEGGAFADCCLSLWCTSCVLCQLHNQQDFEEQNGGGDGKTPGGQNISRA